MSRPPRADSTRTASERLFLALWPDDPIRRQLARVGELHPWQGGRVISSQNVHITLVFLGNVDAERRACIERGVETLRRAPFEFTLTYIEWRRRTGIVWVGVDQVPAELVDLVASLQDALVPCGHVRETRPFRPHVTLARDVKRGPTHEAIAPISWRVTELSLVASRLAHGGSEYTVVRRWPLMRDQ